MLKARQKNGRQAWRAKKNKVTKDGKIKKKVGKGWFKRHKRQRQRAAEMMEYACTCISVVPFILKIDIIFNK